MFFGIIIIIIRPDQTWTLSMVSVWQKHCFSSYFLESQPHACMRRKFSLTKRWGFGQGLKNWWKWNRIITLNNCENDVSSRFPSRCFQLLNCTTSPTAGKQFNLVCLDESINITALYQTTAKDFFYPEVIIWYSCFYYTVFQCKNPSSIC